MQADQPKTPSQELPPPEEKLLRAPTFFEKYAWIKPVSILAILIGTIILSASLLRTNDATISKNPSPSAINTYSGWKTYVSNEGKYSLKYPPAYILSENPSSNTTQIYSDIIPGTNTNFNFIISYKPTNNQTLQQLINENKICSDISPVEGMPSVINGSKEAQIYLDTPCGSSPTTVVYTINNDTFYIISVETQSKFSEIKQYTDRIFSSLKFLNASEITPKLSCRPRPACLDVEFPKCMIPETPDMCPKSTPTKSTVACTEDVKKCPDGTWVGRTGPNCEFVCKQPTYTSALKNACQEKGGTWLDQYQECESIPSDKGLDQAACTALGGTFNACDSACRHNNNPQQACPGVCVKTCNL